MVPQDHPIPQKQQDHGTPDLAQKTPGQIPFPPLWILQPFPVRSCKQPAEITLKQLFYIVFF